MIEIKVKKVIGGFNIEVENIDKATKHVRSFNMLELMSLYATLRQKKEITVALSREINI